MKKVTIIGGGIAGCSSAYFLNLAGFEVTLYEKNTICSGGSLASGAFLSPKLAKPSAYKEYLNNSLRFTLDFYGKNFPSLLQKVPLHKYPKDSDDWQKLQSYEEYIDFKYQKRDGFYELGLAGLVKPKELCYALLEGVLFYENCEITSLDEFRDGIVIIATPNQSFFDEPYLKTKNIGGYRYDVVFDGCENKKFNSHKDISISCYHDNKVAVGATYVRGSEDLEVLAREDSFGLVTKAQEFYPMPNLKVLKHFTGVRNISFDFFPIVGELINSKATLKKYPYIKKGTKVPPSKYIYHDKVYIHTALGSRGFVYAPYNAFLLTKLIKDKKMLPDRLSTSRRFVNYAKI